MLSVERQKRGFYCKNEWKEDAQRYQISQQKWEANKILINDKVMHDIFRINEFQGVYRGDIFRRWFLLSRMRKNSLKFGLHSPIFHQKLKKAWRPFSRTFYRNSNERPILKISCPSLLKTKRKIRTMSFFSFQAVFGEILEKK